jgi:hypothetical protein
MKNLKVWTLLVGLTLFGYFAKTETFGNYLIWLLAMVAVIKCMVVVFRFMELNHAHRFWQVLFVSLIGFFFVGVLILL